MHVLFLVPRYWPAVGGIEKYVRELGKALVDMNHRVTVVAAAHRPGLPDRETHDGIDVFRFPAHRSRLRSWVHLMGLRRLFVEADVVHISDVQMVECYCRMLGWTLRRPVFMTRHGLSYRCPVPASEKRRAARAARLVRGIIDDGHFIAKWLGVPSDVSLEQGLSPRADEIGPVAEPADDTAVFVGRLDWDSGINIYVDAVANLRREHSVRLSLDVYGGGELEASMRARVQRERLPVRFHGFVEGAQKHLANGCFAFVSGRMAIQEAMARRRLVLAAYVNPLKHDYVREEPFSPHVCLAGTSEELADHIVHFRRDPAARRRRVERAFNYARTLTWSRTARGYLDLWRRREVPSAAHPWFDRATLALQICAEFP